ncbi:MAG TPA: hypothetical protein VGO78_17095, partial [Acidimicrobiales bacterium]|nr:hypothetical protein [Acidimicrobiales bacterium]
VDTAIGAVGRRRRVRPDRADQADRPDDVPLDPAIFDQQTLGDLLEFLRHSRRGLLTAAEIVEEAAMWQQIVDAAWPEDATDHEAVMVAIELLAAVPAPAAAPSPPRPVEPANDIERAVAAVAADEGARPRLWRAIYEGDVVLPVVAYELVRPEGANFQFLSVPLGDTPVVLGFGIEERFDALLPEGMQFSRVLAPGRDLPKIWPAGHWLMINAGYEHHVVLSPWEIAGLPDGGRAELPQPRAVDIDDPGDDERAGELVAIVASLAGAGRAVTQVRWARVRGRAQAAGGRVHPHWQDVLVVSGSGPTAEAEQAAVQVVTAAVPAGRFPRMLVIGRQEAMAHPFIEAVLAVARPLVDEGKAGES